MSSVRMDNLWRAHCIVYSSPRPYTGDTAAYSLKAVFLLAFHNFIPLHTKVENEYLKSYST